jgi:hypothetical protein
MTPHKTMLHVILFSPVFVLLIWAVVVAIGHGYISKGEMILFLIVLAISVGAAEGVRHHLRNQIRKESRDRRRASDS